MNDHHNWERGLQQVARRFASLAPLNRQQLTGLLGQYRHEKDQLAALLEPAHAENICRECAGQCCLNGKFRLNVCDALVLSREQQVITPDFHQKPLCPYGTIRGCLFSPQFRPLDCILFICDAVEAHLPETDRTRLIAGEARLREYLQQASGLAGFQLAVPLLLWADRSAA